MNDERKFELRERLIARIARCKRGTYAIITPENKPTELIVCGCKMKVLALWVKQGPKIWTIQNYRDNLIMRSGKPTVPGEYYFGDSSWIHKHSSLDPYPDLVCIAVVASPTDNNTLVGFKGVFNDQCSFAYMFQDLALVDILLWEGQQLEKMVDMPDGGYLNENSINQ